MTTLVYPRNQFVSHCRQLMGRGGAMLLPLGTSVSPRRFSLLIVGDQARSGTEFPRLRMTLVSTLPENAPDSWPSGTTVLFFLKANGQQSGAVGWRLTQPGRIEPIDELLLPGPAMLRFGLTDKGGEQFVESVSANRWSRTIGALGLDVWRRITAQSHVLVGSGRTGSLLAHALTQFGARRLTLVDPDNVEEHNLGEMALSEASVGHPKVEAVAEELRRLSRHTEVLTLAASITRLPALRLMADADVIWSAPDHGGARLVAACVAGLFHKPLIDVGTAVLGHGPGREMGADVRLVAPGRCLFCVGGLRDAALARQTLSSANAESAFAAMRSDFRNERAGSLASLNQVAAGAAIRLWEDFMAGHLREEGVWLRLSFAADGRVSVTYPSAAVQSMPQTPCLCHLSGLGEQGLSLVLIQA